MPMRTVLFFSSRYWKDAVEITETAGRISSLLPGDVYIVTDGDVLAVPDGKEGDLWQIVPMSGGVQPHILSFAEGKTNLLLFAAYASRKAEPTLADALLMRNAAPAVMDVYAVLKRDPARTVHLYTEPEDAARLSRIFRAREILRQKPLLLVGAPEPWVISVPARTDVYREKLGVCFLSVTQEELIRLYEETPEDDRDTEKIRRYFADAEKVFAPTADDLTRCARMGAAMLHLLEKYSGAGMAVACFDLIRRTGVNPCLGVSYINGETEYIAACEGDTDSAVTMRMVRALEGDAPFMANPCLRLDGTVNFAHCTAPVRILGEKQRFWLYDHHETGVGASPRVFYETNRRLTMLRYGGEENALTVQGCTAVDGRYEPNCRTQLCVRPDSMERYLDTLLGCHQVLVFGDLKEDVRALAELLGMEVR